MKILIPMALTVGILTGCVAPVPVNTNTALYPGYLPIYTPQLPRTPLIGTLPVPIMSSRPSVVTATAKALPLNMPAQAIPANAYRTITQPIPVASTSHSIPQTLNVPTLSPAGRQLAQATHSIPVANASIPALQTAAPAVAQTTGYSTPANKVQDMNWLAQRIFRNQTGGDAERLVQWNERGNFAALGLGQFIWYPAGKRGSYAETFPEFLNYAKANGAPIPAWIVQRPKHGSPWANTAAFRHAQSDRQMQELRTFLRNTLNLQANFMAARLSYNMPQLLSQLPAQQRQKAQRNYQTVVKTPGGLYPLLDYAQFKGEGSNPAERYNGKGWGLLQVLQTMEDVQPGPGALAEFMRAADETLVTRIANAPLERREARLLDGWLQRVNTYRPQRRASR